QARRLLSHAASRGVTIGTLGGPDGWAIVTRPKRLPRRVHSEANEDTAPYLRPYDVFDYLPVAADHLSRRNNPQVEELRLEPGMIVLPRSGRNLGPSVAVDAHLAAFILSDDAIRILPKRSGDLPYLLAWMNSSFGQSLIRRHMTGSVIDHVDVPDIANLPIP